MKTLKFLFISGLILIGADLLGQEIQELTPSAFNAKIKSSTKNIVLDVRTPEEFASGRIDPAINIDVNGSDFEKKINSLDKNKTVLVYCLAGVRSKKAATILANKGFKVYNLEGGIKAWSAQGLPVVKSAGK